jgi:hypothetical protein
LTCDGVAEAVSADGGRPDADTADDEDDADSSE